MASIGFVRSLLNGLGDADQKKVFGQLFEHVLADYALGDNNKATNFRWFKVSSTTASVANTEFSIDHGIGTKPSKLIPVLDLNAINSQIVPLTVSRAPDDRRVYLKSSSTSAVFTAYLEA